MVEAMNGKKHRMNQQQEHEKFNSEAVVVHSSQWAAMHLVEV
jgi:hypothetical protein